MFPNWPTTVYNILDIRYTLLTTDTTVCSGQFPLLKEHKVSRLENQEDNSVAGLR